MTKNKRFEGDIKKFTYPDGNELLQATGCNDFFRAEDCNGFIKFFDSYEEADAYLNTHTPTPIEYLTPDGATKTKKTEE